jgi:hypothetical protein
MRAYPESVTYELVDRFQFAEFDRERSRAASLASRAPADARLPAEEPVLGLELDGKARAYRVADLMHSSWVVRDKLAGRDVVILWYHPTGTAAAFSPRTEGEGSKAVTLEHDGSDPVAPFRDRETSSWWGIEGRARSGPLAGKTLEWLPAVQVKWFAWSGEYPATDVFQPAGKPSQ